MNEKLERARYVLEHQLSSSFSVDNTDDTISILLPFMHEGDPIHVYVEHYYDKFIITDGGHVAGLLFSLDHHYEGSELFNMVEYICKIWDIDIDYENGILVKRGIGINELCEKIFDLTRIIITLFTISPFILYGER